MMKTEPKYSVGQLVDVHTGGDGFCAGATVTKRMWVSSERCYVHRTREVFTYTGWGYKTTASPYWSKEKYLSPHNPPDEIPAETRALFDRPVTSPDLVSS